MLSDGHLALFAWCVSAWDLLPCLELTLPGTALWFDYFSAALCGAGLAKT